MYSQKFHFYQNMLLSVNTLAPDFQIMKTKTLTLWIESTVKLGYNELGYNEHLVVMNEKI